MLIALKVLDRYVHLSLFYKTKQENLKNIWCGEKKFDKNKK